MSQLTCLRCTRALDSSVESCPHCGDRITQFQRTYATRLLDGKYQILERLGLGGMGEIFKVRHIHLNEQRVVKIMRSNIATDEQALQRFLHEARLATMIKHRNLAMLYDFSTLDDGSYYMVWEFIEGTNIQKWIASHGPMPPRLSVEVAIQALSGLEALHQMGIIHRDISPENIMLSQDHMGRLLVKVIDFGIAKQLSDEAGGGQGLTQTGMFLGKLKYASPEQAGFIGEGEQLDARSDLYSFGVVFYEMLAGRAPFVATNPQGYILKHATEKPLSIALASPGTEVPPALEAVVLRTLEKNRGDRHANAAELISDLEKLRGEIPPDARFGLGEGMVTVSARRTISETDIGGTVPAGAPGARADQTELGARDDRTMVDTGGGVEPTVADGWTAADSHGPTGPAAPPGPALSGSLAGDAAPTVIEPRAAGSRDTTVVDSVPGGRGRKPLLMGGIAAAVVLIAVAGWLLTRPAAPDERVVQSGTAATTAAPVSLPDDDAVILLVGMGKLESIVDTSTNQQLEPGVADANTPLRLPVPPGSYRMTVRSPDQRTHTLDVTVAAGDVRRVDWPGRELDYDEIARDILRQ